MVQFHGIIGTKQILLPYQTKQNQTPFLPGRQTNKHNNKMKQTTSSSIAAILSTFLVCGSAFTFMTSSPNTISSKTSSSLNMGLFDGVKEAFNAPPGDISAERETPIDRWMGWSARNGSGVGGASSSPSDDGT